ncbi:MAG: orotidine-5'-phosphate decarboxylase [Candidatus Dormibacteraeota bacterium]|nr:orotidine-5'-phosphate decarboxylase [Candidatus Dormibacteraeota bacterium]MBO0760483.1 orotidine-5'-phosphate decarboxylase [Candidatus Dormibacteraeota bacterium]
MTAFFERLRSAAREHASQLCVGLDPDPSRIPGGAGGALQHCRTVVRATLPHACCYKPNAAFWEQYGAAGLDALAELRQQIPAEIPVLYDAKRADVPGTMRAYAHAAFGALGMDAVTAHAYHGLDSLEELTRHEDRGVYVVCRTSNPGGADLQDHELDGRALYLGVAELAGRANAHGNVALVVGATVPVQVAEVRAHSPLPFLLPGVGAQGGDLEASVRAAWTGDPASCLVATSRAVLYADDPAAAARSFKDAINDVLAAV